MITLPEWAPWIAVAGTVIVGIWGFLERIGRMQQSDIRGRLPPGIPRSTLALIAVLALFLLGLLFFFIVFGEEFFEPSAVRIPEPPPGWTGSRPIGPPVDR